MHPSLSTKLLRCAMTNYLAHIIYARNAKGRDFVVSDLHGFYDMLMAELSEIKFDQDIDRLFSVGDLVDRGPESMKCLELVQEPWFHSVVGNHEDMMIRAILDNESSDLWVSNGGGWHIDEVGFDDGVALRELCAHVRVNVPLAITVNTKHGAVGICHAQPPSDDWRDTFDPDDRAINTMIWGRQWIDRDYEFEVQNVFRTIHGHTPIDKPRQLANVLFIDTGAYLGGELTLIDIN